MAVGIACVYGAIVLALRPLIVSGYTTDPHVMAAALPLVLIVIVYHLFDALQITTAFQLVYVVSLTIIKCSIVAFYKRIFDGDILDHGNVYKVA